MHLVNMRPQSSYKLKIQNKQFELNGNGLQRTKTESSDSQRNFLKNNEIFTSLTDNSDEQKEKVSPKFPSNNENSQNQGSKKANDGLKHGSPKSKQGKISSSDLMEGAVIPVAGIGIANREFQQSLQTQKIEIPSNYSSEIKRIRPSSIGKSDDQNSSEHSSPGDRTIKAINN